MKGQHKKKRRKYSPQTAVASDNPPDLGRLLAPLEKQSSVFTFGGTRSRHRTGHIHGDIELGSAKHRSFRCMALTKQRFWGLLEVYVLAHVYV